MHPVTMEELFRELHHTHVVGIARRKQIVVVLSMEDAVKPKCILLLLTDIDIDTAQIRSTNWLG